MRVTLLAIAATSVATSSLILDLTWTDCGSEGTHAKISQCGPGRIIPGRRKSLTCQGNVYKSVFKAHFNIKMTSDAMGTLLQCSGDAARSKTCISPLGVSNLTFDAIEFPLRPKFRDLEVNLEAIFTRWSLGQERIMYTTTIIKATDQDSEELFCIKMRSAPASQCLPNGAACDDKPDPYGCDYTCCSQYWRESCTPISRGGESCSRYCAPFPTMVQESTSNQTMAMQKQLTAGNLVIAV